MTAIITELNLSEAQKFYIRSYTDIKPEPEIAADAKCDVTDVIAYVEQIRALRKKNSGLSGNEDKSKFKTNFSVNKDMDFGMELQWPSAQYLEEMIPVMGLFLYNLNEGKLYPMMLQMLINFAQKHNCQILVGRIIAEYDKLKNNKRPVVNALEAFN